jgi:hypothetical protein
MRRILELYDRPPDDGRVVCVDEFGPLNLQPRKGKTWQRRRKPVTGVALLVGVAVATQVEAARAGRPDLLLADTDDALEVLPRLRTQPRSGVAHAGIARSVRNCARSFQILSRSVVIVVEVLHGFVSAACMVTHAGRQDLEVSDNLVGQDHGVLGADQPDRVQVPLDRGQRVGADPVRPRGSGRFSETGVGDEATGQVLERVQSGRVHRQPLTPPDACDS